MCEQHILVVAIYFDPKIICFNTSSDILYLICLLVRKMNKKISIKKV